MVAPESFQPRADDHLRMAANTTSSTSSLNLKVLGMANPPQWPKRCRPGASSKPPRRHRQRRRSDVLALTMKKSEASRSIVRNPFSLRPGKPHPPSVDAPYARAALHGFAQATGLSIETVIRSCWHDGRQTAERKIPIDSPYDARRRIDLSPWTASTCRLVLRRLPDAV